MVGGVLEEFRDCLDIPVCMAHADVAEIGCELWQLSRHIQSIPIPFDELSCCKGMLISYSLGPRPIRRLSKAALRPMARDTFANVRRAAQAWRRVPLSDTKNPSVGRCGQTVFRLSAYRTRAVHIDSLTGTKRDFPNFVWRIARIPLLRFTSGKSRANASPGRRPVEERRPINVT
jgi:hypothetical protein